MADILTNATEFSVSEIAQAVKRTVEDEFGHVRVRGEISGFRGQHSSGHAYFTLKDEGASIDAVVWKGNYAKLSFKPQEGLEVIATGRLTTFPRSSKYQIVIDNIEPAGAGALMALLEERKRKLAAEGLFDRDRKRALPYLPGVIGVITSPTGAVIRDILHRLADRFPSHVLVWPVRVQGDTCAAEVAEAAVPVRVELVGYVDDLGGRQRQATRRVTASARDRLRAAVAGMPRPADLVALQRQQLDHAAANLLGNLRHSVQALRLRYARIDSTLTPRLLHGQRQEGAQRLRNLALRADTGLRKTVDRTRLTYDPRAALLDNSMTRLVERKRAQLAGLTPKLSPAVLRTELRHARSQLGPLTARMRGGMALSLSEGRTALGQWGKLLGSLSYKSVLARGYAVIKDADGNLVQQRAHLAPGDMVAIEFADGAVGATIAGSPVIKKKPRDQQSGGTQESLF